MNTVKGKNVTVTINVSGTYYPIFCAKTAEFVQEIDEVEITSINSGSSREYTSGMMSSLLTCSGVTVSDNSDAKIAITYLMQQARNTQLMRIAMVDDDGGSITASFSAIIKTNSFTKDRPAFSSSTVVFRVTGAVSWSAIVTPPVPVDEYALYLSVVAGQNSVSHANLDNATILQVHREGIGHTEVSGTPAAGAREFKYTDGVGTGTITFDANQPFMTGEIIYVLFKK